MKEEKLMEPTPMPQLLTEEKIKDIIKDVCGVHFRSATVETYNSSIGIEVSYEDFVPKHTLRGILEELIPCSTVTCTRYISLEWHIKAVMHTYENCEDWDVFYGGKPLHINLCSLIESFFRDKNLTDIKIVESDIRYVREKHKLPRK